MLVRWLGGWDAVAIFLMMEVATVAPAVSRPPLLLRIDEVAERLAISRASTYRLIQRGIIPVVHIGTSVRIPAALLERWLQDQVGPGAVDRR